MVVFVLMSLCTPELSRPLILKTTKQGSLVKLPKSNMRHNEESTLEDVASNVLASTVMTLWHIQRAKFI